jgi:thiol-disulfide isomerase/thioredoxin
MRHLRRFASQTRQTAQGTAPVTPLLTPPLTPLLTALLIVLAAWTSLLSAQPAPSPPTDSLRGRLVPTFAWPSLEDSAAIISPLSLQGKVVLIDLWGTWCAPCRREMPFLHEAYARFHARGFEIVSVSFDISPGKVAAFRRDQFPMPWQHVYATSVIETEATRIFRVDNFPKTVLIGRDGTVLRVDDGLRGPALALSKEASDALSGPMRA